MEPNTEISADLQTLDLVRPEEDIAASGIPTTLPRSGSTSTQSTSGIPTTLPASTQGASGLQSIGACPSSHATDGTSAPRHGSSSHMPSAPAQVGLQAKPAGCEDNLDHHIKQSVRQLLPPGVLDSDIELDYLTPPRSTTTTPWHSTVHLIRTPPGEQLEAPLGLSFRRVCKHGIGVHRKCSSAPDYKPIPLRWPFHVFLFVLVAGLLGFLEYQVHDLPPQQAILLEFDAVEGHAAVADPDPIPPESEYPVPVDKVPHCQWYPPEIILQVYQIEPALDLMYLLERFRIHSTDPDSGWCPCALLDDIGWVSREDPGCHSVLRALVSVKRAHSTTRTMTYTSPYPTRDASYQTWPEKLPEWAPWPAISTDSGGRIFLPLEFRTLDAEAVKQPGMSFDVFGNTVTAPDYTGFYPAMFRTGEAQAAALSTTWWAVPKSRPRSTAPITTTSTSSAATSGSDIQTSTSQVASPTSPGFASQSTGAPDSIIQTTQTIRQQSTAAAITTKSTRAATTSTGNIKPSSSTATSKAGNIQTSTAQAPSPLSSTGSPDTTVTRPPQTVRLPSTSPLHGPITSTEDRTPVVVVAQIATSSPTFDTSSVITQIPSPHSASTQVSPPPGIEQITIETPLAASFSILGQNSITSPSPSPHLSLIQTLPPPQTAQPEDEERTDPTPLAYWDSTLVSSHPTPKPISYERNPQGPVPPHKAASFFNLRTETAFAAASMLPVMLATLLSIPVQILCSSLFALLPFRALQQQHRPGEGAHAEDSVLLSRTLGLLWAAPIVAVRFARRYGDPLPLLAVLLAVLSTVLVPLSSEVVRLEFMRVCDNRDTVPPTELEDGMTTTQACAFGVRGAGAPMRVAEGVLAAMALLVVGMGVLVRRWRTGVAADPWSMASMAGLLTRGRMRDVVREMMCGGVSIDAAAVAGDKRFRLGYEVAGDAVDGGEYYGVRADETNAAVGNTKLGKRLVLRQKVRHLPTRKPKPNPAASANTTTSSGAFWGRWKEMVPILALILIVGLLILILYYENTSLDTPFETFMDSQSFGVRALFTACGTAVNTFDAQLYHRLATAPLTARDSILLSPPSHVFAIPPAWITSTTNRRSTTRQDALAIAVAIAALLGRFTPILFANIPFRNTVTWRMHETCTWMAVAVLAYMVVVLMAATFPSRWWLGKKKRVVLPILPVDPDTIAACMSYLCDSAMVDDFAGLAVVPGKKRDRMVEYMGKRYVLRYVVDADVNPQMPGAESRVSEARVGAGVRSGATVTADVGIRVRKVVIDYA